jgi:lactate dehydrogenase-like 2-hydroxyacid dehydrogenase
LGKRVSNHENGVGIVNCARGVIDEVACKSIRQGKVLFAGLDVLKTTNSRNDYFNEFEKSL